ncbi:hypothetical protein TNCV_3703531 [Trichonephila clavipes]|nr:hypothetical protein TNCV_3703531 [Trichonephila clavipes]
MNLIQHVWDIQVRIVAGHILLPQILQELESGAEYPQLLVNRLDDFMFLRPEHNDPTDEQAAGFLITRIPGAVTRPSPSQCP